MIIQPKNAGKEAGLSDSRGFVMATSLILLAAVSVFSLSAYTASISFVRSSERSAKRMAAFNMAEAGFDQAFYSVKNSAITTFPYSSGYTSMNSGSFRGGYSIAVTDMGNSVKKIAVTGYSPSYSSTTEPVESRTVTGYIQTGSSSSFDYAAFGSTEVTINGNATIDSYNSSLGAYNAATNAGTSGSVGTNATGAGKLSLQGSSIVKGNLKSGVGSNPTTVITKSGSASYTGTRTALTSAKSMTVKSSAIASSGNLNLNGNTTLTLPAGTYRYSSVKINGNARLVFSGAVTLYVDGEITLNGNGVTTASNKPSNTTIYGTSSAKVTLNGNSSFYGGIYAPLAEFEVNGNTTVYGSVIGNDLEINGNAKIHFDTSMGGSSSPAAAMLSWSEGGLSNS